jgi:3-oxoacyl-[acyl-carrier protein] reductase
MSSALILGASGDIGQAIARELAGQGWSLYLHYFHHETIAANLADELSAKYPKQDFFTVEGDLTDVHAAQTIADQLFSLDAVIVAAGMTYYELFKDASIDHMTALMRVHLLTPMALINTVQDKLAVSGHGRIVFIGSVYGASGSAMEVTYSTVKGAQSAFAKAYAQEVASLGITVNVVAPGAVATKMNREFGAAALEDVRETIPAGRFAQADDIAYFVGSLVHERAGYLTGQTLYVTGGWLR